MHRLLLCLALVPLLACGVCAQVSPVPSLMTFQGRLAKPDGTSVSDGTYSVRFSLWDALTNGTEKWNQTVATVNLKNGTFAVLLSGFPAETFNGNLWLEIKVGNDNPLTPRQQLVSVAYAMKANSVPDGSIGTSQLADGSITADKFASDLFNPLAWLLGGNSGTDPSTNFLGTTDNQPLVFKVNNRQAMRYSYAENIAQGYRSINALGGADINTIGDAIVGATIAGGGEDNFMGTDAPNQVTADYGSVGGGLGNTASGKDATIAGGAVNTASNLGATVSGGAYNTASGFFASVGGGYANIASGSYSFAAGLLAQALHKGTFVWADNLGSSFSSSTDNQFSVRATNGFVFESYANPTFYTSSLSGEKNRYLQLINSPQTQSASGLKVGGLLVSDSYGYSNPGKNDMTVKGRVAIGYDVNGTSVALYVNGAAGGTTNWTNYSDARFKKNVETFNNALDTILNLRGVTFDWKPTPGMNFADGRQIGFIAQELEKVLPELVSTDSKGYKSVAYANVVPVLVEAMKQQQKQRETDRAELKAVRAENAEIKAKLAALATAVAELKAQRK